MLLLLLLLLLAMFFATILPAGAEGGLLTTALGFFLPVGSFGGGGPRPKTLIGLASPVLVYCVRRNINGGIGHTFDSQYSLA